MAIPRLSLPNDASVTGISIVKQDNVYDTYPVHCHEFDELFFIFRGRAIHNINGQHQIIEKGSLVFIRPDDMHCYSPLNDYDFGMYTLGFPPDVTRCALDYTGLEMNSAAFPPQVTVYGADYAWLENRMERLWLIRSSQRLQLFRAIFPAILEMLLGRENAKQPETAQVPPWLARLEESMRLRENYIAGLDRLLELCPYSQEYLNRMFRLYLKTTPTEYINARRMTYATELLLGGEYSITEICFATGFNNLSHFYTVFHRMYGCTPKEFVRRMTAEQMR